MEDKNAYSLEMLAEAEAIAIIMNAAEDFKNDIFNKLEMLDAIKKGIATLL